MVPMLVSMTTGTGFLASLSAAGSADEVQAPTRPARRAAARVRFTEGLLGTGILRGAVSSPLPRPLPEAERGGWLGPVSRPCPTPDRRPPASWRRRPAVASGAWSGDHAPTRAPSSCSPSPKRRGGGGGVAKPLPSKPHPGRDCKGPLTPRRPHATITI